MRIVVRRDHVGIRLVDLPLRDAVQRAAVDDQMVRIELFDVGGDLVGPLGRGVDLVARLPAEDRLVVAVGDAR